MKQFFSSSAKNLVRSVWVSKASKPGIQSISFISAPKSNPNLEQEGQLKTESKRSAERRKRRALSASTQNGVRSPISEVSPKGVLKKLTILEAAKVAKVSNSSVPLSAAQKEMRKVVMDNLRKAGWDTTEKDKTLKRRSRSEPNLRAASAFINAKEQESLEKFKSSAKFAGDPNAQVTRQASAPSLRDVKYVRSSKGGKGLPSPTPSIQQSQAI